MKNACVTKAGQTVVPVHRLLGKAQKRFNGDATVV
jgi:hypothetical protein